MFVTTVGRILTLVFKGLVKWGKNSVGWHFAFLLTLIFLYFKLKCGMWV